MNLLTQITHPPFVPVRPIVTASGHGFGVLPVRFWILGTRFRIPDSVLGSTYRWHAHRNREDIRIV